MESFNGLQKLYDEVKQAMDISKVLVFVVGNKNDQYEYEQVKKEIAGQYANSINATHRIVSALKADGINELFDCVGRSFFKKGETDEKKKTKEKEKEKEKEEKSKEFQLKPEQKEAKGKNGCC